MQHVWLGLLLTLAAAGPAGAEMLQVVFSDPVGDPTGDIDAFLATLVFDDATGDYTFFVVATEAQPFLGEFRLNVNLFNPDVGSTACAVAYLSDTVNDFDLAAPVRRVTLTGSSPVLTNWSPGDRVATNDVPFGTPDCNNGFGSGVVALPFQDPYPGDDIAAGNTFAVVLADLVFIDGFESGSPFAWSSSVP